MLTLFTILAVIYFLWDTVFYENFLDTAKKRTESIKKIEAQVNALQGQISSISVASKSDPIKDLSNKVKQLTQQNKNLEDSIGKLTKQLIPPEQMLWLLQDILAQDENLHIIRVDNLPETSLFATAGVKGAAEDKTLNKYQVYRHGLQIELVANYFNTRQFLERVERLPWKILWDDISYEVTDYPDAKVKITVYTLSLNRSWISS
jgi:MSHA biogenesis protein MshJ